jgi:hypothetical protein
MTILLMAARNVDYHEQDKLSVKMVSWLRTGSEKAKCARASR